MLSRIRSWLEPLVYLTNNVLSLAGVVLVTASAVLWIVLLPTLLSGEIHNPYMGILLFMGLPGAFFAGLFLIPFGMWMKRRRGHLPETYASLDWKNAAFRRLIAFVAATTVVNLIIAGQLSYGAVNYMDSVQFCGQTCHTVMQPEFVAYQNSPHARVECVKCHIGPGAAGFAYAKVSGMRQLVALARGNYSRPIHAPVKDLGPASDVCEQCHWPEKFHGDKIVKVSEFSDDEKNTETVTTLTVHVGGGSQRLGIANGIHWHMNVANEIEYVTTDDKRQEIPYVRFKDPQGNVREYFAEGVTPEKIAAGERRRMDCIDCHNRPSHQIAATAERAVDQAIARGEIPKTLPFVRREVVKALKVEHPSQEVATEQIATSLREFFRTEQSAAYASNRQDIERAVAGAQAVYSRNVFPEMKVKFGTYVNNIGHMDSPGCFRCHDDSHKTKDGKAIGQECETCHLIE